MAISLKHAFESVKADGVDATLVQPSNWNAEHTFTMATSRLLGRTTAATGAVEEISVGASLGLSVGVLSRAALTGDVTAAANSNATTIAAGAVTASKLADTLDLSGKTVTLPAGTVSTGFSAGDAKFTFKTVADSGWVMADDGSIGSAASVATNRANDDTEDLFTVLWNNIADADAPVSGGRGASAAADFAANKTMTLPKTLGRVLGVAGAGAGLTSRALGSVVGAETAVAEVQDHVHGPGSLAAASGGAHTHTVGAANGNTANTGSGNLQGTDDTGSGTRTTSSSGSHTHTMSGNTGSPTATGSSHANMQPTSFLNLMVKL